MREHYHLVSSIGVTNTLANVRYDDYGESIEVFSAVAMRMMQPHITEAIDDFNKSILGTANPTSPGTYVAVGDLCLLWMRCHDECASGSWN